MIFRARSGISVSWTLVPSVDTALRVSQHLSAGLPRSRTLERFGADIERGCARVGGKYGEIFTSVSTERGSEWVATLDFGLTYGLTDNVQLDGGVNIGLTRSADDVNPFLGISMRF